MEKFPAARDKKYFKILNRLSFLLIGGTILCLILFWNRIPDRLPIHYNGAGEADSYGGKGFLVLLPFVSLLIVLPVTLLEKYPEVWNTGVKVTKENSSRVLGAVKGMLIVTKFAAVSFFTYLSFCMARSQNLGTWSTPVFLAGVFGPIAYFSIRIFYTPKKERRKDA